MKTTVFNQRIIDWSLHSGRHNLPWQKNKTPYRIWVSEVMLQQTQVKTVIPYFRRFVHRFPSIKQLASAELDEVLQYWAGLGYYSRARYLHQSAKIIHQQFHGRMPRDLETLMTLPGIGRSTAGAILALCHNQSVPILDGNVKRILCRHQNIAGWSGDSAVNKKLWRATEQLLPKTKLTEYTQGLMDLGAMVCSRSNPQCAICPVHTDCKARIAGTIQERPEKKPSKAKPTRSLAMIMLTCDKWVLLQRRPPQGIWGSLLCFPETTKPEQAKVWCHNFRANSNDINFWRPLPHTFTHFTLNIHPVHIRLNQIPLMIRDKDDYVWCKIGTQLAVPAPVKQLLQQLNTVE